MRKSIFVTLAAAAALAACGDSGADTDGDGKISEEEMAAEAAGAVAPRPGQYETKMQLLEIEMPEVAGVDTAQMKGFMEQVMNQTTTSCITAEDARDAAKQMVQGPDQENCTYSKFNVAGGDIDAQMSCKMPDGSTNEMTLSGTMGREASSLVMELDQELPNMPGGGQGKTHFKLQVDSKRIGECPA